MNGTCNFSYAFDFKAPEVLGQNIRSTQSKPMKLELLAKKCPFVAFLIFPMTIQNSNDIVATDSSYAVHT